MSLSFGWDPTPSSPLGLTARLAPSWRRSWSSQMAYGMGSQQMYGSGDRVDAEVGHGLPVGARLVGTPRVGIAMSTYGRDYRFGYGLGVLEQGRWLAPERLAPENCHSRRFAPLRSSLDRFSCCSTSIPASLRAAIASMTARTSSRTGSDAASPAAAPRRAWLSGRAPESGIFGIGRGAVPAGGLASVSVGFCGPRTKAQNWRMTPRW